MYNSKTYYILKTNFFFFFIKFIKNTLEKMNHNHFFLYNNTKVGSMKGRFKKKKEILPTRRK